MTLRSRQESLIPAPIAHASQKVWFPMWVCPLCPQSSSYPFWGLELQAEGCTLYPGGPKEPLPVSQQRGGRTSLSSLPGGSGRATSSHPPGVRVCLDSQFHKDCPGWLRRSLCRSMWRRPVERCGWMEESGLVRWRRLPSGYTMFPWLLRQPTEMRKLRHREKQGQPCCPG